MHFAHNEDWGGIVTHSHDQIERLMIWIKDGNAHNVEDVMHRGLKVARIVQLFQIIGFQDRITNML